MEHGRASDCIIHSEIDSQKIQKILGLRSDSFTVFSREAWQRSIKNERNVSLLMGWL